MFCGDAITLKLSEEKIRFVVNSSRLHLPQLHCSPSEVQSIRYGGRFVGVVPGSRHRRAVDSRNVGVTPACCFEHCHPPTGSPPVICCLYLPATNTIHHRYFNVAGNALATVGHHPDYGTNGSGSRCNRYPCHYLLPHAATLANQIPANAVFVGSGGMRSLAHA